MKRILTYGTFDILHFGHIRLLQRAKEQGDYLIVAVSTDEFNAIKGKKSYYDYETRKNMLECIRYVDLVIPEYDWEQKPDDIKKYSVDTVLMGSDWKDNERFEALREHCDVVYLERTEGISSTMIRSDLHTTPTKETISVEDKAKKFLKLPSTDEKINRKLVEMGVNENEIDNELAMIYKIYKKAKKGNVESAKFLKEINNNNLNLDVADNKEKN